MKSPKGAVHIRAYGEHEIVQPMQNSKKHGVVKLILARLHPLNPETVIAYYGRPTI
jgi:hypothetical protein